MSGRSLPLMACLGAVLALAGGVRLATRPPPVPAADPGVDHFHADRALTALTDAIGALEPRPPGSAAHARARDGLVGALQALGAEVEVQDELLQVDEARLLRVRNVVGRLRGEGKGEARVLAAHYDSVPSAPGAADDGSGVAVVLEVARALRAGPPLRHDLLLVLTDAEELGLHGARAFLGAGGRWGPLAAVVNLEARGVAGPSLVFEVGPGVAPLLRGLARPQSTSVAAEVYRRMPNDTDFTEFRRAGLTGFNLAFIEGWPGYHAPFDDLAHLDRRSVQHQGDNALALVRALDAADLPARPPGPAAPDAAPVAAPADGEPPPGVDVFFDLAGRHLVLVPPGWLTGLGVAGALAALIPLLRREVRPGSVAGAVLRHLAGLGLGLVLASVPGVALARLSPGAGPWHPHGWLVVGTAMVLGWVGMALVMRPPTVPSAAAADPPPAEPPLQAVAALPVALALLIAAGGAALGVVAPGAAHLLVLPGAVLGVLATRGAHPLAAGAGAVALGILLLPLAWTLPDVVGVGLPAVLALPVLLVLAPLAPLVRGLAPAAWRWGVGGGAALGVGGVAVLASLPPFDAEAPGTTVARVDASGVALHGQGPTGEVAGVSAAAIAPLLPAPHLACARAGAAWEIAIVPPEGGVELALTLPGAARLGWGPHEGELAAGGWALTGVGPEGVRLSMAQAEPVVVGVKVARRGALVEAAGVSRGEAQVPRGPGDRATWAGEVRCPTGEAGPVPTVRPGSERPPSTPRARRRG